MKIHESRDRARSWTCDSRPRFTLIELLVVVAIIMILLALLLPCLQKAKRMARTIVCISNQREIGTAVGVYISDNMLFFPNNSETSGDHRDKWFGHLAQYIYKTDDWSASELSRNPTPLDIFVCPEIIKIAASANPAMGEMRWDYFQRISCSYSAVKPIVGSGGYNFTNNVYWNDTSLSTAQLKASPATVMFSADGSLTDITYSLARNTDNWMCMRYVDDGKCWSKLNFIHGTGKGGAGFNLIGKTNCVFVDGHVEQHDRANIDSNRARFVPRTTVSSGVGTIYWVD